MLKSISARGQRESSPLAPLSVTVQLSPKRTSADAESLGGGALVHVFLFQDPGDDPFFDFIQRTGEVESGERREVRGVPQRRADRVRGDIGAVRLRYQLSHHGLHLCEIETL